MAYNYRALNEEVTFIRDKTTGELIREIGTIELGRILEDDSVLFFPGRYEAPYNIMDLVEKEKLKQAEAIKFLTLVRKENLDKNNMLIVDKQQTYKPANLIEIGKKMGIVRQRGENAGSVDEGETRKLYNKLKKLEIMIETFNSKLNVTEYFINPLYRKPASRLNVNLYGLFRNSLFRAMTVKSKKEKDVTNVLKHYKELTTNAYRDAIEFAYQEKRKTTEGNQEEIERVVVEVAKTAIESYHEAMVEDDIIAFLNDKDAAQKHQKQYADTVKIWLKDEVDVELNIEEYELTAEKLEIIKIAIVKYMFLDDRTGLPEESKGYLKLIR